MWLEFFAIAIICIYLVFNFWTAMTLTVDEMKRRFINRQCFVGMVFANIFYAPAWLLKGLRFLILNIVA